MSCAFGGADSKHFGAGKRQKTQNFPVNRKYGEYI